MCLGIPGKIVETGDEPMRMGRVSFAGIIKQVCLAYCPEAETNDYVIVHAGFAISVINEAEARKTLEYLQQLETPASGGTGEVR